MKIQATVTLDVDVDALSASSGQPAGDILMRLLAALRDTVLADMTLMTEGQEEIVQVVSVETGVADLNRQ